ncbi:Ribosomal protein S6--L-glutamate ligase [subsurface metagenome]
MNIGLITVRGHDYHPNRRLGEAAAEQGHRITLVHPYRVWPGLEEGEPSLVSQPGMEPLDVVLPRQGATVGDSCLALIHHFSLKGIPVVNNLDSIRITRNKFLTLQTLATARIPLPDTLFVNSGEGFQEALARLGGCPVVAKQSVICDHLDRFKGLLVQRFIPPAARQDIRVLVVGRKVAGAMELRPKEGDFRANYHLSGESRPKDLPPKLERIALKAAGAVGLEIAGVDLIVDQNDRVNVIEVNYSPGFKGLEAATGLDIAGTIVDYVASAYGRGGTLRPSPEKG